MSNFKFDYESKTIVITNQSFLKRANRPGTPEYLEMISIRTDFPGFAFRSQERKAKVGNINRDYTFEKMEEYIKAAKGDDSSLLDEMKKQRDLHSLGGNPYKAVLAWFLGQFPDAKAEYDKKAKTNREKREELRKQKEGLLGSIYAEALTNCILRSPAVGDAVLSGRRAELKRPQSGAERPGFTCGK